MDLHELTMELGIQDYVDEVKLEKLGKLICMACETEYRLASFMGCKFASCECEYESFDDEHDNKMMSLANRLREET
jgi:hypothetical protein